MSIPLELVQDLSKDPLYEICALTGSRNNIQWHHVFTFAGKSIQRRWAVVPITKEVHDNCTQHNPKYNKEVAERVELIALNRATRIELMEYSKVVDLVKYRDNLRRKYDRNTSPKRYM